MISRLSLFKYKKKRKKFLESTRYETLLHPLALNAQYNKYSNKIQKGRKFIASEKNISQFRTQQRVALNFRPISIRQCSDAFQLLTSRPYKAKYSPRIRYPSIHPLSRRSNSISKLELSHRDHPISRSPTVLPPIFRARKQAFCQNLRSIYIYIYIYSKVNLAQPGEKVEGLPNTVERLRIKFDSSFCKPSWIGLESVIRVAIVDEGRGIIGEGNRFLSMMDNDRTRQIFSFK